MLFYIAASFVISAALVIGNIFAGRVGEAAYGGETDYILHYLLILSGFMLVRVAVSALSALYLGRFAAKAGYTFRTNFVKFFLRQPFANLERTNTGENLSIFTNDLPQAAFLVSNGALGMIMDFAMLIAALVYMFYLNWIYTLIFIALFPVLAVVQVVISIPIQKVARAGLMATAEFNAVVNDSLQNTSTVISYSLETAMEDRYMNAYEKVVVAAKKQMLLFSTIVIAGVLLSVVPMIYIYIVSGMSVITWFETGGAEGMTIAQFIAFTGVGIMAASWLMMLSQSLGAVKIWMAGAVRFNDVTTGEAEERKTEPEERTQGDNENALSFNNVTFAYGDGADVLHGVSFSIPVGGRVALIGGSGSGKSTILKLMLGLYEPKGGNINVLGEDTTGISKFNLRERFAYVPQDSFLFPESISENITGKKNLSKDEQLKLEKACSDAGILEFINTLPDKFNAVLTESAENVSGGQRQRIAIARALYKDAPIILFDEATSALDPGTEAAILQTLENAVTGKTLIMVAHRASAKAFCDTVITLEGGRTV